MDGQNAVEEIAPPVNVAAANEGRQPYNVEFMQNTDEFCEAILRKVPELEAVAVVPVWANQPENVPPGLLRLSNPTMPYAGTLIQLLNRMAVFNMAVHSDLVKQIKILNGYVVELSDNIREKLEELNALNENTNNDDHTNAAE